MIGFLLLSVSRKREVCSCCGSDGVSWQVLSIRTALDQAGPSECGNLFRFVLFCDPSHQFYCGKSPWVAEKTTVKSVKERILG